MLPPISSAVFEQNPKFKILYNDLNASRLTADGSSKLLKRQRAQDELRKKLQFTRAELAKTEILVDVLEHLSTGGTGLLPELVQVVQIICAQLDGSLTAEDREVLVEDFEIFVERIDDVAKAVSMVLVGHAEDIAAIIEGADETDAETRSRSISTLTTKVNTLRANIASQSSALAARNMQIAETAVACSDVQRELLQSAIRILEQSIHGTVTRATQARAEYLATVARGMELKLAIITHAANTSSRDVTISDPNVKRAIEAYSAHLRSANNELAQREHAAANRLNDYAAAGQGMQEIAKRFAELTVEIDNVKDEIARLRATS